MKVFFVPFNNKQSSASPESEELFTQDIINHATEYHIDKEEKAIIFLYLTDTNHGFLNPINRCWPEWLDGIHVRYSPEFSLKEAEDIALELAQREPSNIVLVQPFPSGALDEQDVSRSLRAGRERWNWSYCLPLETEDTANQYQNTISG